VTERPRIGLLHYGLDRPLSGVTRSAIEISRALRQTKSCEVVCLAASPRGSFVREPGAKFWYLPGCSRLPALMLLGGPMIAFVARRLNLDLVHDPIGISPFTLGRWSGRFARVTTLHDAIAFRYPEGYPWLNNLLHRRYVPATLHNVDAVITDSQAASSDLQRFLGLVPEKLCVVPLAAGREFRVLDPDEVAATLGRYGLTQPYILHIGAQQARKNAARLLEAFATVHAQLPACRLVLAGPSQWRHADLRQQVAARGLDGAVSWLGYVPDANLPAVYNGASVFAFPSLYEGFGLPVLEAMACGTPVVCSNATSLPEVAGDAALLVDPYSVDSIAAGLLRVLTDHDLRADLRQQGLQRAAQFAWERTARETLAAYQQVLGG
jgi:glycosyltransferase involved in cell wall biosynthesis